MNRDSTLRVRVDREDRSRLRFLVARMGGSKSDIIRTLVKKKFDELDRLERNQEIAETAIRAENGDLEAIEQMAMFNKEVKMHAARRKRAEAAKATVSKTAK